LPNALSGPRYSTGLTFNNGGVKIGTTSDRLSFAAEKRLDARKGRISFEFKPDWNGQTNNASRYFFQSGALRIFIYKGSTKSYFVLRYDDGAVQREITTSPLEPNVVASWQTGNWYNVVAEWDLTQPDNTKFLRFEVDGHSGVYSRTNTTSWSSIPTLDSTFAVGMTTAFATPAGGTIRNLAISTELGPEQIAYTHIPLESSASVQSQGGTVSGSGVTFERGEIGQGAGIRTGGGITFPNNGELNRLEGTISFRFKPDWNGDTNAASRYFFNAGALRIFTYYSASNNKNYFVLRYDDNASTNAAREVSSSTDEPAVVGSWKAGEWHTIEVFWNLTNTNRQYMGYSIDGQQSKANFLTWTNVYSTSADFTLGAYKSGSSFSQQAFGVIDEVRIYTNCLWDAENPVSVYTTMVRDNGIWEPHETIHDSSDAPALSPEICPTETFLFYSRPKFERVFEGTVPEESDILSGSVPLAFSLLRDEHTTFFFNLFSRVSSSNVKLEIATPFTRAGSGEPLEDVELRLVKNWWQAGISMVKSLFPHYIPELLLCDDTTADALLLSDPLAIRARGWQAGDYPSFPIFPYVKTSLKDRTSRQFALLVRAPSGTEPGFYDGVISLKDSSGAMLKELPVRIEVRPLLLEKPGRLYSIYYNRYLTNETTHVLAMTPEQYQTEIRDLSRHGLNSAIIY
ncbi:MAG: hypothetical protein U1E27_06740, partial [Kiritimatiellia bacterium]|nr:hypothetical protein [Kiritimatiellia bacterium]